MNQYLLTECVAADVAGSTLDRLLAIERGDYRAARAQIRRDDEDVTDGELNLGQTGLQFFYGAIVLGVPEPVPSPLVDRMWRAHMSAGSRAYGEFCDQVFGSYLHRLVCQSAGMAQAMETCSGYQRVFQRVPSDILPGLMTFMVRGVYSRHEFAPPALAAVTFPSADGPFPVAAMVTVGP